MIVIPYVISYLAVGVFFACVGLCVDKPWHSRSTKHPNGTLTWIAEIYLIIILWWAYFIVMARR